MHHHVRFAFMTFTGVLLAYGVATAEGHPEPIFQTIDRVQAGEYSIKGDHGRI